MPTGKGFPPTVPATRRAIQRKITGHANLGCLREGVMNLYSIALFVHMLGLIALFGGLVMIQNAGRVLRGSAIWEDARRCLVVMRPTAGMFAGGAVLLLLSGLYMTSARWSFSFPSAMTASICSGPPSRAICSSGSSAYEA